MAKKKMTAAQAAAARRPDDWEPPEQNVKSTKKQSKPKKVDIDSATGGLGSTVGKGYAVFFVILFVIMAIAAPFIVIYVSQFLGIS